MPVFDAFIAEWPELFEWEPPAGGCVCFPRYLGEEGVQAFCRALLKEAGVVLLPAGIFTSPLAEVLADRFRIGLGRRDPESALAAFGELLRGR
jgi:aspartate/methionine/tyrosine aminotransferase